MSTSHEPTPPEGIRRIIEEARTYERAARFSSARALYERALHRLGGVQYAPLASALLRWIGRTWEAEGELAAAMDCLEAAQAAAEACGSARDLAHALNCRGILHFHRGELERAERLYGQARELAESAGEARLLAMVDQNLGNVANVHGDHAGAHARYLRSLERYRALGLDEFVGPLLMNIGRVHVDREAWSDAESVLDCAETSCETTGNVSYQILIRVSRTHLHLSRGELTPARRACEEALRLSSELGEDRWLGEIHKHLGMIHQRMGHSSLAEAEYARALRVADKRQELLLGAEVRKEMARLYGQDRRHHDMFACLSEAHRAFEQLRAHRALADVSREIEELEASFEQIVNDWGDSIESADHYTQGHCERVADHACRLALASGLDKRFLTWFRMGALLHDVGKVSVPSRILNKCGPLNAAEWRVMKEHPLRGVRLLAGVDFPWDIRPMVLHHHEHWDGSGYPYGLGGEEIPFAARVLCVADVYDALTTNRSYRRAFTSDAALEIMARDAGRVFDPELFEVFASLVKPRELRTSVRQPMSWDRSLMLVGHDTSRREPPVGAVA